MRETSLDEFVGGDGDDRDTTDEPPEEDPDAASGDGGDPEGTASDGRVDGPHDDGSEDGHGDVAPTLSTLEWTPGGAACAACGATVERRWRDGEDLVCSTCKPW